MNFIILFAAELVLGGIVGFILSDNRKGLSIEEIRISSVLFLLSTAIVFWKNPEISGRVYASLAFSWIVLIIGVLLGELVKMRIINKIISSINKKDIQIAINELVQMASQSQLLKRDSDRDALYKKLYEVQNLLHLLANKSKRTQTQAFLDKLHYLFELCEDYVSLSIKLCDKTMGEQDTECLKVTWLSIGEELTSLSWDTLNHAEQNIKNELGKAFSMQVVKQALHI